MQVLFQRLGERLHFVVEVYESGSHFLAEVDDERPGCIVLDLMLPDATGIDVLRKLVERGCRLPVVFMSGIARVSEAVEALKLGSIDFLEKPFDIEDMSAALQRAVAIDRERRRDGLDRELLRRRFASLTPREAQVMEHIVRGAANKEVAALLGLSHKTVEVHRANVMRKTRAGSLAELVRMHVALKE